MYASPYYAIISRSIREDMIRLKSIYDADKRRDIDKYFDHDDDSSDHEFDDKGGLFIIM